MVTKVGHRDVQMGKHQDIEAGKSGKSHGFSASTDNKWCLSTVKALVCLGALAAVGASIYRFTSNQIVELTFDEEQQMKDLLRPVCDQAARQYTVSYEGEKFADSTIGNKKWHLGEYIKPSWKPTITFEEPGQILCEVDIQSDNCDQLVGNGEGQGFKFVWDTNYESIPGRLPEDFPTKYKAFIAQHIEGTALPYTYMGAVFNATTNTFNFKSHVFCTNPNDAESTQKNNSETAQEDIAAQDATENKQTPYSEKSDGEVVEELISERNAENPS